MPVDSYRWLPGSLTAYYQALPIPRPDPRPWTPFVRPLTDARIALITTAGLYDTATDEPFDLDGERANPVWGDPSFRAIPADITQDRVGVSHLHYNTTDVLRDVNCALPIDRLHEAAAQHAIGSVAARHFSFMGFQLDQAEQLRTYVPRVIEHLRDDGVDAVVLTPT